MSDVYIEVDWLMRMRTLGGAGGSHYLSPALRPNNDPKGESLFSYCVIEPSYYLLSIQVPFREQCHSTQFLSFCSFPYNNSQRMYLLYLL